MNEPITTLEQLAEKWARTRERVEREKTAPPTE